MRKGRMALASIAVLFLAAAGWLWWSANAADIESMERTVRRRFPEVRQLSTQELSDWLKSDREKPFLLDVREADEYAVSHLPGARRVDPSLPAEQLEAAVPKDAPVVTYCSVGWRSSSFAKRLQDAGYKNVQNLEGSIFRWANEDRPLVRDGKPADEVHPYSRHWGRLVKPGKRADLSKSRR